MTSSADICARSRAFIFDMDGVIYRGKTGAARRGRLIARLRRAGIPYLFLTNNSTTPPADVAERLRGMGIEAGAADIIRRPRPPRPSARGAAGRPGPGRRRGGHPAGAFGGGFHTRDGPPAADAVVVGMDREATYARLKEASLAIQARRAFSSRRTCDASLPSEEGLIPGAGSLVGMLEIASGQKAQSDRQARRPASSARPWPGSAQSAEMTACVGDRPETDILGGQAAGLKTIAVLTGVGSRDDFEAMRPPPDWVFEDFCASYLGRRVLRARDG